MIKVNGDNDLTRESLIGCVPHFHASLGRLDFARTVKWFLTSLWPAESSDATFLVEIGNVALENVELVVATVSVEFQPEVMILIELKNDFVIDWGFDFEDVVLNNELKVEY